MRRVTMLLVTIPFAALLAACSDTTLEPTAVSAEATAFTPSFSAAGRLVLMLDACDPESFNAVLGPGTCAPTTPRAGIPFSTFISLLELHQRVDAWRFSPDRIRVNQPVTMSVPNRGGILHSFTEVEEFGGGFVPILNFLSGNPVPAPECVHPMNPEAPHPDVRLIAPGDADEITFQPGVEKKYMCCIHPWMRAVSQ